MITQGRYWQAHLEGTSAWLESWHRRGGFEATSYAEFELRVFTSCFAARKLLESQVGPQVLESETVVVCKYPRRDESINPLDSGHFTRNYRLLPEGELSGGEVSDQRCREVLNIFIHSYHFSPFVADGKVMGVFVASDRTRNEHLLYLTVPALCGLFRAFASAELREQNEPA